MSGHNEPQSPQLIAALKAHGMAHDTPSQLSDGFRCGWYAGVTAQAAQIKQLRDAAEALGAMPEGYCFCSKERIGDDSKIHEPECADLRAALEAKP